MNILPRPTRLAGKPVVRTRNCVRCQVRWVSDDVSCWVCGAEGIESTRREVNVYASERYSGSYQGDYSEGAASA